MFLDQFVSGQQRCRTVLFYIDDRARLSICAEYELILGFSVLNRDTVDPTSGVDRKNI